METLQAENKQLVQRFNEQLDERKKEIEFWVQERALMRDKIDALESANVVPSANMFNLEAVSGAEMTEKLAKKLRTKDLELKQLKSDLMEKKS